MSTLSPHDLIYPDWPAPDSVNAIQTTRHGGVSKDVYAALNLSDQLQDDPMAVATNRQRLSAFLPSEPVWLKQVHGVRVIDAAQSGCLEQADASVSTMPNVVCVTMTADCLPVLLCDQAGTVVAAVHAGWRSLCDGVIEAAITKMAVDAQHLMAWLGPAIGPKAFEVGSEVRQAFIQQDAQAVSAFVAHGDKWLGDLYQIAKQRLANTGVTRIYGGSVTTEFCTYTEQTRFFSFRRDQETGRMASLIWIDSNAQ